MKRSLDEKVIDQFKWFFKHQYITHRDGNAAYKTEGGYAVTASGIKKNDIKRSDFLLVNSNLNVLESYDNKKPSIESGAHITLLENSGKNASIHVHSPNTVALAGIFESQDLKTKYKPTSVDLVNSLNNKYPELFRYTKVGSIVPFYVPGSSTLHHAIVNSLVKYSMPNSKELKVSLNDICIMERHGVIAIGDSLDQCLEHIVRLEHISGILLKMVTASGKLETIL